MPRMNLDRSWMGESQRLSVRLGLKDRQTLEKLCAEWGVDRSEAIRRALSEAEATNRHARSRQLVDRLPGLNAAALRAVAANLRIVGRSRMPKAQLTAAILSVITREAR